MEKMLIQFSQTPLIAVPTNIERHSLRLGFMISYLHTKLYNMYTLNVHPNFGATYTGRHIASPPYRIPAYAEITSGCRIIFMITPFVSTLAGLLHYLLTHIKSLLSSY
jgi:hypothetical protein